MQIATICWERAENPTRTQVNATVHCFINVEDREQGDFRSFWQATMAFEMTWVTQLRVFAIKLSHIFEESSANVRCRSYHQLFDNLFALAVRSKGLQRHHITDSKTSCWNLLPYLLIGTAIQWANTNNRSQDIFFIILLWLDRHYLYYRLNDMFIWVHVFPWLHSYERVLNGSSQNDLTLITCSKWRPSGNVAESWKCDRQLNEALRRSHAIGLHVPSMQRNWTERHRIDGLWGGHCGVCAPWKGLISWWTAGRTTNESRTSSSSTLYSAWSNTGLLSLTSSMWIRTLVLPAQRELAAATVSVNTPWRNVGMASRSTGFFTRRDTVFGEEVSR